MNNDLDLFISRLIGHSQRGWCCPVLEHCNEVASAGKSHRLLEIHARLTQTTERGTSPCMYHKDFNFIFQIISSFVK